MDLRPHKSEVTGNALLDRIQNNVRDLVEYLRQLRAGDRLKMIEAEVYLTLTADKTNTGAGAYVDLMSTTFTSVQPVSVLQFTLMASFVKTLAAGGVYFTILVDGVQVADSTYLTVPLNSAGNCCLLTRHPVKAGVHTITVQWAGSPNAVVCRPATNLNEFCSLVVKEIPS